MIKLLDVHFMKRIGSMRYIQYTCKQFELFDRMMQYKIFQFESSLK